MSPQDARICSMLVRHYLSFLLRLLPGFTNLNYVLHLYDKVNSLVTVIAMELFVIVVETVVLYAVSRSPIVLKADSKLVSWRLALLASLLGNVGSALVYPLVLRVT